jgi:hypothetical protein
MFGDEGGSARAMSFRRGLSPDLSKRVVRMKKRIRRKPRARPVCRRLRAYQLDAIRQFQDWDQTMMLTYGPLYHRLMGYPLH